LIYDTHAAHKGGLPYGLIERSSLLSTRAGVSMGAPDDEIRALSTWQLQQLRRVAHCHARMGWRDNQIRAEQVLSLTWVELTRRGACQ